jgi:hypothetical protein
MEMAKGQGTPRVFLVNDETDEEIELSSGIIYFDEYAEVTNESWKALTRLANETTILTSTLDNFGIDLSHLWRYYPGASAWQVALVITVIMLVIMFLVSGQV